jgi:CheY-like chemotaxis protein
MESILIIDDDPAFLDLMRAYLNERHPGLAVQTCVDPISCLGRITADLRLLLIDLEMPGLDGSKVLAYAKAKGVSKDRIIILSARSAEYLHNRFPMGSCLAVMNKYEIRQKEALDMIFSQLEQMGKANVP